MTRVIRFASAILCLSSTSAFAADLSSTVEAEPLPIAAESSTIAVTREAGAQAFTGGAATPQTSASPKSASVPVATLGEVVVTASRMPTLRRETPDTVSVVTREDLDAARSLDLGDAVSRTAGVDSARHGGTGSLSSITIRGSRSSQVLVLEDGRPLNSVSTGQANAALVPAGGIDRVEVLRGPSGLLYGSSPLGGVVSVITPAPPAEFTGEIAAEDGTYGTRLTRVSAGGPLGPVRFLLRDERTRTDGHRPNSDARTGETFLKAEVLANPRIEAQAGAVDGDLGVAGPGPAADPVLRSAGQAYFGNDMVSSLVDRQKDRRRWVMTGASYSLRDVHAFSVRHYAEENRLDFTSGSYYGAFFGNPSMSLSAMTTRIMGLEGQYVTGPWEAEGARLTAGASWRRERLGKEEESFDLVTGDTTVEPGFRGAAETGAGYAELSLKPLARLAEMEELGAPALAGLSVAAGLRRDRNSLFGSVTNGHAGAAWEVGGVTARASAGETFRAPSLNDLFWPSTSMGGGNPNLAPERGRTAEWSVERSGKPGSLRVGAYSRKVRDQIDWAPDAAGVWMPRNTGLVRVRGEEAEGVLRAGRVRLNGSFATIRAVQRRVEASAIDTMTGAPVATVTRERTAAYTPAYTASAALTVRLPWGLELAGSLRHVGARAMYIEEDDWFTGAVSWKTKRLDPFTVASIRASARIGRKAEAWVGVGNLTDEKYAESFGNDANDNNYPMPPRTLFAGASVAW